MRRLLVLAAVTAGAVVPLVTSASAQAGPISTDQPPIQVKEEPCGGGYNVYVFGHPLFVYPQNVWCPEDPAPS